MNFFNDNFQPLVFDNGSSHMRVGFSGDDAPRAYFPTIIGKIKIQPKKRMVGLSRRNYYIGETVLHKRGVLNVSYPMKRGQIVDLDDMKKVWKYALEFELRINENEMANHPILLSENVLNPKSNREKMTEAMFEEFRVPGLAIGISSVLSHYASGRCSGLDVDVGEGSIRCVGVYEGYSIVHAISKSKVGGGDVTNLWLKELLKKKDKLRSCDIKSSAFNETVRDMKEKSGFISLNYDLDNFRSKVQSGVLDNIKKTSYNDYLRSLFVNFRCYKPLFKLLPADCVGHIHKFAYKHKNNNYSYVLPDGDELLLNKERYHAPEVLFRPILMGSEDKGIHELIVQSLKKCPVDISKDFMQNILISGGSSLFQNFHIRLEREVKKLLPRTQIKINCPAERKFSVFIGGSILSSLSTFQNTWMTKQEYDESGSNLVHRKFF